MGWWARGRGMINGRHPHRRLAFIGVVAACWVVGLFGLDRSRMSSFQLPIVVAAGFIGYAVVVAVRRRLEDSRDRREQESADSPHNCVVIRRFGEDRSLLSSAVKVIEATRSPLVESPPVELKPLLVHAAVRVETPRPRRDAKKPQLNYIPLTGI